MRMSEMDLADLGIDITQTSYFKETIRLLVRKYLNEVTDWTGERLKIKVDSPSPFMKTIEKYIKWENIEDFRLSCVAYVGTIYNKFGVTEKSIEIMESNPELVVACREYLKTDPDIKIFDEEE